MLIVPFSTSVITSCVADGLTMTVPLLPRRGLHGRLHGTVDDRDQHRGAKALPEMTVDLARQARAAQFVRARRSQRHDDARRRAGLGPQHEDSRRALLHLAAGLADQLGAALQQHDLPSTPKVSVAVTQVVMPGSVESMAVSRVQSMNAPLGSSSRCVGSTWARTAVVTLGRSSVPSSPGSCGQPTGGAGGAVWPARIGNGALRR